MLSIFDDRNRRTLRKALHCACGHTIAFHDAYGCGGVTMGGGACDCKTSDAAALEAGINSFRGSHARLRRHVVRSGAAVVVHRR